MSKRNRERRREGRGPGALVGTIRRVAASACVLCGGPPAYFGAWKPTPELQRRLHAPPGKARLVAYSLCDRCAADPSSQARIEDRALAFADSHGPAQLN